MSNSRIVSGLLVFVLVGFALAGAMGAPFLEGVVIQTDSEGLKHFTPLGIYDLFFGSVLIIITTISVANKKD